MTKDYRLPQEPADYNERVEAYEAQGVTRSDAQAIVDAELLNEQRAKAEHKFFIIQEENGGIPDDPFITTDEAKANAHYLGCVIENVDFTYAAKKPQNIDEAVMVMNDDWDEEVCLPEDWHVRMWEYDLKELGLCKMTTASTR